MNTNEHGPRRPNILVFCTDEQRGEHLGCMGHPILKTPNIDRIAADGTLFRNCFTSSPVCMPARATMLTGLTNRASGVRTQGVSLSEEVPTLPGLLAHAGYRTHSVGKLHHRPWGGRTIAADDPGHQAIVLEMFKQLVAEITRTESRLPRFIGC